MWEIFCLFYCHNYGIKYWWQTSENFLNNSSFLKCLTMRPDLSNQPNHMCKKMSLHSQTLSYILSQNLFSAFVILLSSPFPCFGRFSGGYPMIVWTLLLLQSLEKYFHELLEQYRRGLLSPSSCCPSTNHFCMLLHVLVIGNHSPPIPKYIGKKTDPSL